VLKVRRIAARLHLQHTMRSGAHLESIEYFDPN
jgi:hypothetical protein